MTIDQRGGIAIAEIILYFPILILSIFLIVRHGATRKAGWIFFAILSIGESSILHKLSVLEEMMLIVCS